MVWRLKKIPTRNTRMASRYFRAIVILFALVIGALAVLSQKYFFLTAEHFVSLCRQTVSILLFSGVHYAGLGVLLLVAAVMAVFMAKAVFSLLKTRQKMAMLLKNRMPKLPYTLRVIC